MKKGKTKTRAIKYSNKIRKNRQEKSVYHYTHVIKYTHIYTYTYVLRLPL